MQVRLHLIVIGKPARDLGRSGELSLFLGSLVYIGMSGKPESIVNGCRKAVKSPSHSELTGAGRVVDSHQREPSGRYQSSAFMVELLSNAHTRISLSHEHCLVVGRTCYKCFSASQETYHGQYLLAYPCRLGCWLVESSAATETVRQ